MTDTPNLALTSRYHAAWLEHGTRIAQRQNTVQMYLLVAAAIFGFYFHNGGSGPPGVGHFLLFGITFLTSATTMILWMHHRVMQNLCAFMARCEELAQAQIRAEGGDNDDLFYFYEPAPGKNRVHSFHPYQRRLHRIVLSLILGATNGAAIGLTWRYQHLHWAIEAGCIVWLVFTTFVLYWNLGGDLGRRAPAPATSR